MTVFFYFSMDLYASSMAANYLSDQAKKSYKRGDFESAIHEFSKALLADPDHEQSKEYLKKMGIEKSIYDDSQRPLTKIKELGKNLKDYQQAIDQLQKENLEKVEEVNKFHQERDYLAKLNKGKELELEVLQNKLEQKILVYQDKMHNIEEAYLQDKQEFSGSQGTLDSYKDQIRIKDKFILKQSQEIDRLTAELNLMKEEISQEALGYKNELQKLTYQFKEKTDELVALNERLERHQEQLANKTAIMEAKDIQLKEAFNKLKEFEHQLKGQTEQYSNKIVLLEHQIQQLKEVPPSESQSLDSKVFNLEKMLNEKEEEIRQLNSRLSNRKMPEEQSQQTLQRIKEKDEEIAGLKSELMALRQNIEKYQTQGVSVNEQKYRQLMVDTKLQLMEKEDMIVDKTSELVNTQQQLAETQGRLNLVQRIIEEKELAIKQLEEKLTAVLAACTNK